MFFQITDVKLPSKIVVKKMFRKKLDIEFIKSCPLGVRFPDPMEFEIAVTGRSNVGKSSLINTMTNVAKIARVSSRPGCTQAVNYFKVDNKFFLADLPGYGYAKAPKRLVMEFRELMQDYFEEREEHIIGLQIVDSRRGILQLDEDMMNLFIAGNIPFIVVATKIDKLKKQARVQSLRDMKKSPYLKDVKLIPFSSHNGEGKDELNKALDELLEEYRANKLD